MGTYLGHDRSGQTATGGVAPAATADLAQWASGLQWPDLTEPVVRKSQQGILDTLGVALAGTRHPAAARVAALVDDLGGAAQATAIGSGRRTSAQLAALYNAYAAHVLDFDDTHLDAIIHVNAPVIAAALAVAELRGGDGRDLILAHVAGLEVSSRAGVAVTRREPYGWHPTGLAGCFGDRRHGSAAGAGRRADARRDRRGEHARQRAAGHRGTMAKGMSPANAASNGVVAALAASHGMTASPTILEDADVGFLVSYGVPITAVRELTDQLGRRFRMLDWEPKPYPCGVVIHPAVDAALAAREAGSGTDERIVRVELEVPSAGPRAHRTAEADRRSRGQVQRLPRRRVGPARRHAAAGARPRSVTRRLRSSTPRVRSARRPSRWRNCRTYDGYAHSGRGRRT